MAVMKITSPKDITSVHLTNHTGDVADIYHASLDGRDVVLKVAKNQVNNFLIINEFTALSELTDGNVYDPDSLPELEQIERIKFAAYMPEIIEAGEALENGVTMAVNILAPLDGFYPLSQVVADLGPLDAKDAAWIWRRLLVALGFVHTQGWVHAAVYPEHIMIDPISHGLVLIDWCYARPIDNPAHAYISRYHDSLPREFLRKRGLTPAIDVRMATEAMLSVVDATTLPPALRGFSQACTSGSYGAWHAKEKFDLLIERSWGPRKFRPMVYTPTA